MPKTHSCGAILWSVCPDGNVGVILGKENRHWLPFKGGVHSGETKEQAACREVWEETAGLVTIKNIDLCHSFVTSSKHYHIGLCRVDYGIISAFAQARERATKKEHREKSTLKFFALCNISSHPMHVLAGKSVVFFWRAILRAHRAESQ